MVNKRPISSVDRLQVLNFLRIWFWKSIHICHASNRRLSVINQADLINSSSIDISLKRTILQCNLIARVWLTVYVKFRIKKQKWQKTIKGSKHFALLTHTCKLYIGTTACMTARSVNDKGARQTDRQTDECNA